MRVKKTSGKKRFLFVMFERDTPVPMSLLWPDGDGPTVGTRVMDVRNRPISRPIRTLRQIAEELGMKPEELVGQNVVLGGVQPVPRVGYDPYKAYRLPPPKWSIWSITALSGNIMTLSHGGSGTGGSEVTLQVSVDAPIARDFSPLYDVCFI